ncbi:MAG: hypothetical protein U1F53_19900 [Burkholderiaceae bacterium]
MSTLTHPTVFAHGRAASLKQVVSLRLAGLVGDLWAALEAAGRRRAAPHLLLQARLHDDTDPALAASLRLVAGNC